MLSMLIDWILHLDTHLLPRQSKYNSDPAAGNIELSVPNVGLDSRWALAANENYFYFTYEDRAYEYLNGRAGVISSAIRMTSTGSQSGFTTPIAVSIFNNRAIFTYYDTMYVFSLITRTWSRWQSPQRGGVGRMLERRSTVAQAPQAYAAPARGPQVPPSTEVWRNKLLCPVPSKGGWTLGDNITSEDADDGKVYVAGAVDPTGNINVAIAKAFPSTPTDVLSASATVENVGTVAITMRLAWTFEGSSASLNGPIATIAPGEKKTLLYENRSPGAGTTATHLVLRSYTTGFATGAKVKLLDNSIAVVAGEAAYAEGFSGDSSPDEALLPSWLGAVNDSESVLKTKAISSRTLLRITDAVTADYEDFQCVARTKVFSFDTPQAYKRLFWWGLDGIFRMDVAATVTPIVYGGTVTWGELYERGVTWGQLLFGTWSRPVSAPLTVETIRPEIGSAAQRKFTKFLKKLRFRQLQFQVVFDTRGDFNTAPVRLFSLHAEVTPAQTVVKSIS